jgi:hypothetical protein
VSQFFYNSPKRINMKKTLFILLISTLVYASASAQSPRFSLGAELAIPTGDFGDAVGVGYGLSLRYEGPIADQLAITADLGYLFFTGKDITFADTGGVNITQEGETTYLVPIQLGLKYYFMDQQDGFYAQLLAGAHLYESQSIVINSNGIDVNKESKAAFSYAPAIGYHFGAADLGLRYQLVSTTGNTSSYLGFRIAYVFGSR